MKLLSLPRALGDRLRAAHAADPRRIRAAFLAVLAVVVLLMSFKYADKIHKPDDKGGLNRSAFLRWRDMINGVFSGANIYVGVNEYPNPPIMAILLRPFTALPPVVGALAWFYAKVLLAVISVVWVFGLVRPVAGGASGRPTPQPPPCREGVNSGKASSDLPEGMELRRSFSPLPSGMGVGGVGLPDAGRNPSAELPLPDSPLPAGRGVGGGGPRERGTPPLREELAKGATIILCLPALLGDLSHNNVNIFILFLIAGCLEAFRRRLDGLAGLTLALAVACKVTPLLFVAYFGWKRCWRVLEGTAVGLVLWLVLVPVAAFGWERTGELMSGWYALMIERPLLKGEITTEHPNQAVVGFVYRLFTHSPSYVTYPDNVITPSEYHNLTDIGRPAAWVLVKLLTALFALAVVRLCRAPVRGPGDPRRGWRFAAECGLICLGMLLFSERTWKHHAVVLLVPVAALTYAAARVELPRRVRGCIVGALGACFVLTAGPGLLAGRANDLTMVYGTHTIAFALLAVAVGLLLACRSGRADRPCGPPDPPIPG